MIVHPHVFQSSIAAILLFFVGLATVLLIKSPERRFLRWLFVGAFAVRVACVYLVYFYLLGVGGDGFAFFDDRGYDAAGRAIAAALNAGKDGYQLYSHEQNVGYFYFIGWLYSTFDADTLSARVINAFFSSFTAIFAFEIARKLCDIRCARVAGILMAFLPSVVYWSALQFKDAALILFTAFIIYLLVCRAREKASIFVWMGVVITLFVLWFLRKDYCLPLIGMVLLWICLRYTGLEKWMGGLRERRLSGVGIGVLLILGAVIIGGAANTQVGKTFFERYDRLSSGSMDASGWAESGVSRIGFTRYLRVTGLSDIYKLPLGVGFTVAAPLPAFSLLTNQHKAGFALYSVANSVFIALLPFVFLGFFSIGSMAPADAILVRWFPLATLLGITIIFMGVLRYKEQLMPFFVLWAAAGIARRANYRATLLLLYVGAIVAIVVAVVLARLSA